MEAVQCQICGIIKRMEAILIKDIEMCIKKLLKDILLPILKMLSQRIIIIHGRLTTMLSACIHVIVGLVEICLMHPLDVVKTRLQIQKSGTAEAYTSVSHCFKSMYRNEG